MDAGECRPRTRDENLDRILPCRKANDGTWKSRLLARRLGRVFLWAIISLVAYSIGLSQCSSPSATTKSYRASMVTSDAAKRLDPGLEWHRISPWPLRNHTAWDISTDFPYARVLNFDVEEGTWIRLDVHPVSGDVVFGLLGGLYCIPEGGTCFD
jgi:hypothetical protein